MADIAAPTGRAPHLSREDRDHKRREIIARIGYDPTISEAAADEIREHIAKHWNISGEDFTGLRLTFFVMPLMTATWKEIHEAEAALMQTFGNAPHNIATQFETYKLQFIAN